MEYRLCGEFPSMRTDIHQLQKITGKTFRKAKQWYLVYLGSQALVLVLAIASILARLSPNLVALSAFLCVLATEFFRWKSDAWKSEGESAKRKWETVDALGLLPDSRDLADWIASKSKGFLSDVTPDEIQGSQFSSRQPKGHLRALENVLESAWWSKHESRRMGTLLAIMLAVIVTVALAVLSLSIGTLQTADVKQTRPTVQNVGGVICSVLAFVLSINLVRLLQEFTAFSREAAVIVRRCNEALESSDVTERDALFIMHDYQSARNSAPLLPTFIWRLNRAHLQEQWKRFRPKIKVRSSSGGSSC